MDVMHACLGMLVCVVMCVVVCVASSRKGMGWGALFDTVVVR